MKANFEYDVFISHAFEDKSSIADELNKQMRIAGIRVFYSGQDLVWGEDLDQKLFESAVLNCRYALVILSKEYVKEGYAKRELDSFFMLEKVHNRKIILPVWHQVEMRDIQKHVPYLRGRLAIHSDKGIEHMIVRLKEVLNTPVNKRKSGIAVPPALPSVTKALRISLLALGSLALLFFLYSLLIPFPVPVSVIEKAVKERIDQVSAKAQAESELWLRQNSAVVISKDTLAQMISVIAGEDNACGRNNYIYEGTGNTINTTRAVQDMVGCDLAAGFYSGYGMKERSSFAGSYTGESRFGYLIVNLTRADFKIKDVRLINDKQAVAHIKYQNALRFVNTDFIKQDSYGDCEEMQTVFFGLPLSEEFYFERINGEWKFSAHN